VTSRTVPAAGAASYNGYTGTYTTSSTGDIALSATSDKFHYDYQTWTPGAAGANGTLTAYVAGQSNTSGWDKAGAMFRDDNTGNLAGAMFAAVLVTPSNGVEFAWRSATGGATSTTVVAGQVAPLWTRVIDVGGVFSGYYSSNGTTWTQIGIAQPITFSTNTVLAGLASASGSTVSTTSQQRQLFELHAFLLQRCRHQCPRQSRQSAGFHPNRFLHGRRWRAWGSPEPPTNSTTPRKAGTAAAATPMPAW